MQCQAFNILISLYVKPQKLNEEVLFIVIYLFVKVETDYIKG